MATREHRWLTLQITLPPNNLVVTILTLLLLGGYQIDSHCRCVNINMINILNTCLVSWNQYTLHASFWLHLIVAVLWQCILILLFYCYHLSMSSQAAGYTLQIINQLCRDRSGSFWIDYLDSHMDRLKVKLEQDNRTTQYSCNFIWSMNIVCKSLTVSASWDVLSV